MRVLNEANYVKAINSYSMQDWKPLLDLIPKIAQTKSFGESFGGGIKDGVYYLPNWSSAEIVYEFQEIVYKIPIIIGFNWGGWDEGRKIASDETFDFDKIDIPTKCKLITAFVRNDRFCDGALSGAFQRGTILKILKSIEKQLEEKMYIGGKPNAS